jgi:hypothetical protein
MDVKFARVESSRFIGDYQIFGNDELGFRARDIDGWLDCVAPKDKLGVVLMRLRKGDRIRVTGTVWAPVLLTESDFPRAKPVVKVEKIQVIKPPSQ